MHMDKSALYHAHPPEFFLKKNQIGIPTSRGELLLLLENSSMLLPREVVDVMEEDLGEEAFCCRALWCWWRLLPHGNWISSLVLLPWLAVAAAL